MKKKKGLIGQEMSKHRKRLVLLVLTSSFLGFAIISQATIIAEVIQKIVVEGVSFSSIVILLAILLVVMAVRTLLSHGNGKIGLTMAATAKKSIRSVILQRLSKSSISTTLGGQTGGKVSIALDAVDEADSYFSQYMPRMIEACIIPLLLLIATFILHPTSAIIMLVTAPFIPLFMILVGLKTKNKSEEKYAQLAQFSGTFLDSLQGLVTLKIFGRANQQKQQIERSSLSYRDATMDILKIAFTNTFMLETVVMLSIGIVALELAIQLLIFKSMTFHTAFLVLLLVPEFYSLLKNTGTAFHSARTSMGAVQKIEQILEEADALETDTLKSAERDEYSAIAENNAKVINEWTSLELEQLCFSYAPSSFKLDVAHVSLKSGSHIAIVGKSGSGKTTLLNLIAGLLQPTSGQITLDGIDLNQMNEAKWFEKISYITQHPYIFAGTFADNIAIGAGREVTRAEIEQAAEDAGLTSVVAQLENGFDTFVGEGGRGLSGGEKQRLALARAFLKRPKLILFDEPTVGLDLYTERILQSSITTLSKSATMITVAHRLYTIRHADRIWFMENGQLIDTGCHEALLARLPQYAEMIAVQGKGA